MLEEGEGEAFADVVYFYGLYGLVDLFGVKAVAVGDKGCLCWFGQ